MRSIIIIGALPSSLLNFRGDLIRDMLKKGWDVTAMASGASALEIKSLARLGVKYIDYPVQRNGLNPVADFRTLLVLRRKFKSIQPDIIFAYTIKPVIWGGIASKSLKKTKFTALITGLGFAFENNGLVKQILTQSIAGLYRWALRHAKNIIFQNEHNRGVFISKKIVSMNNAHVVNGSGVNIDRFPFEPLDSKATVFLLIARLLKDKGIQEYLEAAAKVKKKYPDAVFQLMGPSDPSPNAFPISALKPYIEDGTISYISEQDDVRPYLRDCQIYVLPSYHEGLPRTVIEAMSTGRPIITTDAPGCRDTIIKGEQGYMVPVKNSEALADAMLRMITNRSSWIEMGKSGRQRAEELFNVTKVNETILNILE